MAVSFAIPSSPARSIAELKTFKGCDLTNSPLNMNLTQSPNCVNMVRDVPGKIRKTVGYEVEKTYYVEDTSDKRIWNEIDISGNAVYADKSSLNYNEDLFGTVIVIEHGNGKFAYEQYSKNSDFVCGYNIANVSADEKIIQCDAFCMGIALFVSWTTENQNTLKKTPHLNAYELCTTFGFSGQYVPTITISRSPNGGGEAFEEVNLLTNEVIEQFLGTASDTVYEVSFDISASVIVSKLNADGTWTYLSSTDYTYSGSKVTFTTAPGVSPITGQDNIKIKYIKNSTAGEKLYGATAVHEYISNGSKVFFIGGFENSNIDYHTYPDNLYYVPDTSYAYVGDTSSAIVGYATVGGKLITFKNGLDGERNIVVRDSEVKQKLNGSYDTVFKVVNTLVSDACISRDSIKAANNEVLYLTHNGIYAVTNAAINGERVTQMRSFYLNGALLKEDLNLLKKSVACIYDNYYGLFVGNKMYLLDLLQPMESDSSTPYSDFQYACFLRRFDAFKTRVFDTNDSEKVVVCFTDEENRLHFVTNALVKYRTKDYAERLNSYEDPDITIGESDGVPYGLTNFYKDYGEGLTIYNTRSIDGSATRIRFSGTPTTDYYRFPLTVYNEHRGIDSVMKIECSDPNITFEISDNGTIIPLVNGKAEYRTYAPGSIMNQRLIMNVDTTATYEHVDVVIYTFHKGEGYIDSGNPQPIYCCYETPDLSGQLFYKNKTLRYIALRLGASLGTSDKISVLDRGLWTPIKEDVGLGGYFTFSGLSFGKLTFKTDRTSFISKTKARIKKVDKFRLRVENDKLDEQLIIDDIGLEFVENGNYKG